MEFYRPIDKALISVLGLVMMLILIHIPLGYSSCQICSESDPTSDIQLSRKESD